MRHGGRALWSVLLLAAATQAEAVAQVRGDAEAPSDGPVPRADSPDPAAGTDPSLSPDSADSTDSARSPESRASGDSADASRSGVSRGSAVSSAFTGSPDSALMVPDKLPVHQYRVGAGASGFMWDEDARAEDGLMAGFDVERDLAWFLAARAGLAYGGTELRARGGAGEPVQPVDTRLYLPEISLLLQPPLGGRGGAVVPYAVLGFGSLITDPAREGLNTRSQNAFAYGAGARFRFGERLGVRGELKRYLIKLEDTFIAEMAESESIRNTRVGGSLTYAF